MVISKLRFSNRRLVLLFAPAVVVVAVACSSSASSTQVPRPTASPASESGDGSHAALPEPVASYSFDGDASDGSGNGNEGRVNGATTATDRTGAPSSALSFDGVSAHVVIPDSDALDLADQFSFSVWLNHREVSPSRFFTIFEKSGDSGGHAWYGAWLFDGGVEVCVEPTTNAPLVGPQSCFDSELKLRPGEWHHVAGIYDGSAISIFIDGVAAGSRAFGGSGISTNSAPLFIATDLLAPSPVFTPITLDDLQIFDVALNEAQVMSLFESPAE